MFGVAGHRVNHANRFSSPAPTVHRARSGRGAYKLLNTVSHPFSITPPSRHLFPSPRTSPRCKQILARAEPCGSNREHVSSDVCNPVFEVRLPWQLATWHFRCVYRRFHRGRLLRKHLRGFQRQRAIVLFLHSVYTPVIVTSSAGDIEPRDVKIETWNSALMGKKKPCYSLVLAFLLLCTRLL